MVVRTRSETRAARAARATRANILIAKTISDSIISTFLGHRRHKYPLLSSKRILVRVYPSRPSFGFCSQVKNENLGDSGKLQNVSYFELKRIFMSSMSKRIEIKTRENS